MAEGWRRSHLGCPGEAPEALVRMATGLEAGCRGQNCPPQALDSPVTIKVEVFPLQQEILENMFFKTMCLKASMSSQNSEDLQDQED